MNFNLDLCQTYESEIVSALFGVVARKKYILSDEGAAFEREWAAFNKMPFAVGVGNGTDALRIALLALGIGPGDEVISPAFNVAYTAQAVQAVGAKNVYVDVDEGTMLMDIEQVKNLITPRTRAILPVHLFGQMVNMCRLSCIADDHHLLLIEDAAQCHGATIEGTDPGYYSHAACYSHYPTKNLGALGEAGSIVTRLPIVNERARLLRDAGRSTRYIHLLHGINSCLDEIQAAVLRVKLSHLRESNARRQAHAYHYMSTLVGIGDIKFQFLDPGARHVYHLFVIRTERREALMKHLTDRGITALAHYPCTLPNQPFAKADALDQGPFPVADRCARTVLSLPLWPDMTEQDINTVVAAIKEFYA